MDRLEDSRTGKTLYFIEPYDPNDEHSASAVSSKYVFVADRVITFAAGSAHMVIPPNQQELRRHENNIRVPNGDRPKTSSSTDRSIYATSTVSSINSTTVPQRDPTALFLNADEITTSGPNIPHEAWEAFAELRDKCAENEKIGWWIVYNGDPERAYEEHDHGESDAEGAELEGTGTRTPTQAEHLSCNSALGQPLPSLLPPELKHLRYEAKTEQVPIATAIPHPPPPPLEKPAIVKDGKTLTRPKSSRSFSMPLRKKPSKANLPIPKNDDIPDPPKLKEMNKKEGFRLKFFGRRGDKD